MFAVKWLSIILLFQIPNDSEKKVKMKIESVTSWKYALSSNDFMFVFGCSVSVWVLVEMETFSISHSI